MSLDLIDQQRLLKVVVDVPHLKLAIDIAHKEGVWVDLVQVGGTLLVFECLFDGLAPSFDVDVADNHLLFVETRNGQHG